MKKEMTRRTVGKILLAAPVLLSIPKLALPAAAATPVRRGLTPKQRKDLAKSVAQLRKARNGLYKMAVPMGAEPAFIFRPLVRPGEE